MLNTEELMVLLVNELIMPRSFHVKPTQVMFVSGLGRIDYVQVIIFSCTFCPEIQEIDYLDYCGENFCRNCKLFAGLVDGCR